jgi:hypothetical protein
MTMNRRHFVLGAATAASAFGCQPNTESQAGSAIAGDPAPPPKPAQVVIIGGTCGGVAAALAACKAGAGRVVVAEASPWLGGQLTAQLVPPDEHKWIESTGATKSYRDYRDNIRKVYRTRNDRSIRPEYRNSPNLNPGMGWVSRLCHEPAVGAAVLEEMLKPYVAIGQLTILRGVVPVEADVDGDTIKSVTVANILSGQKTVLLGTMFVDATDEGDVLPLAKVEFVTGSEAAKDTGEPNASPVARPGNIQSFTWCYALEHRDGEEHVIEKPKEYDFWRQFPDKSEPLFNWDKPAFSFYPKADRDPKNDKPNFWTYRRVIAARMYAKDTYPGDVTIVNYHQNDYTLGSLHGNPPDKAQLHRERSKQMSLSLLYWLQTECPRSDGKKGWPGLKLSPEQAGTTDGLAQAPYIRESRRIKALFTIKEQHCSRPLREKEMGKDKATAMEYKDSCGIGHYLYMDLHATAEGEKKGGWPVFPFQIALGALIPQRVTNLIAGAKNLGVTHLTNGCYRLHPVEWNIGEAAGALAAVCAVKNLQPKQVRETPKLLEDYQRTITDQGFVLAWPADAVRG